MTPGEWVAYVTIPASVPTLDDLGVVCEPSSQETAYARSRKFVGFVLVSWRGRGRRWERATGLRLVSEREAGVLA